ncbi:Ribosomal protein S6 kinase beta-2, partial [Ophiophagus hannah]
MLIKPLPAAQHEYLRSSRPTCSTLIMRLHLKHHFSCKVSLAFLPSSLARHDCQRHDRQRSPASPTTPPSGRRPLRQNDAVASLGGVKAVTKGKGAWPGNARGTWGAPDMAGVFDIDLETEEGSDGEEPELGALRKKGWVQPEEKGKRAQEPRAEFLMTSVGVAPEWDRVGVGRPRLSPELLLLLLLLLLLIICSVSLHPASVARSKYFGSSRLFCSLASFQSAFGWNSPGFLR